MNPMWHVRQFFMLYHKEQKIHFYITNSEWSMHNRIITCPYDSPPSKYHKKFGTWHSTLRDREGNDIKLANIYSLSFFF